MEPMPKDHAEVERLGNTAIQRILSGWSSKFHNRVQLIELMKSKKKWGTLTRKEKIELKTKLLDFLDELRREYQYLNVHTAPAIEFLINIFKKYPKISEKDILKIECAIDHIYDGFDLLKPAERSAMVAAGVAKAKARLNTHCLSMVSAA